MREVKRKVPRETALGFHSGFAEPINYQFFSLSPRPWNGYPPVHREKANSYQ
jgi:hypothetical protein